jgi:hypothetical protein
MVVTAVSGVVERTTSTTGIFRATVQTTLPAVLQGARLHDFAHLCGVLIALGRIRKPSSIGSAT